MSKKYLDLEGTKYLLEEIKEIIESEAVDLSDYVTRTELQKKLDELEIDIDLDDYATKEYVINAINNAQIGGGEGGDIDLSIYALKSELDGKADTNHTHSEYLTEHQDISGKADKTHTHKMADVTDYVAPDLSTYAKKTDIPSLNGYATETYVNNAIANIPLNRSIQSIPHFK